MKRILLFFISLIFGVNALAGNLTSTELEDVFGSVRAELVRQICYIAEISDTTVLNNIENRSLKPFKGEFKKFYEVEKDANRKKELSQIDMIINTLPSLSGDNVNDYVQRLNFAIANSITSLYKSYPDRAYEILCVQKRLSELLYFIILESNCTISSDNRSECIIENAFARLNQKKQNDENDNVSDSQSPGPDEFDESTTDSKRGCGKNLKRILICIAFMVIATFGFWFYRKYFKLKPNENNIQPKQMQVEKPSDTIEQKQVPVPTTQQSQINQVEKLDVTKVRVAFAEQSKDLSVVGASVIGLSHIQMNKPCQDYCGYEELENGWGIAITSDGAGSAEHSEVGSKIVVERGIFHFKQKILSKKWMAENMLPTDAEWTQSAYYAFKSVYDDLKIVAEKNGKTLSSLAATAIVLIHTPRGILVSHIGDGRAGYADLNGCWKSIIVPHKGEEANQTIFMTSEFWNIPNYVMSGVIVPESRVIRDVPSAFALMSDGCENTCWLCNRYDEEKQMYGDPNEPYDKFFTSICTSIESMRNTNEHLDDRKTKWANYLLLTGKFAKEPDDKTMIVGTLLY